MKKISAKEMVDWFDDHFIENVPTATATLRFHQAALEDDKVVVEVVDEAHATTKRIISGIGPNGAAIKVFFDSFDDPDYLRWIDIIRTYAELPKGRIRTRTLAVEMRDLETQTHRLHVMVDECQAYMEMPVIFFCGYLEDTTALIVEECDGDVKVPIVFDWMKMMPGVQIIYTNSDDGVVEIPLD